jgi:hypothetical protein
MWHANGDSRTVKGTEQWGEKITERAVYVRVGDGLYVVGALAVVALLVSAGGINARLRNAPIRETPI